jgi:peptidyl-prolyl cis-trans isomerase D
MLSFFRQRGLSNILYGAIIVATILTFVIEFRPSAGKRTASLSEACVAHIRGRCLAPKDFSSAYRILMPSRSAELSRRMNLKRVALDGLIERELLDDEAKRLGISVTDEEVTDQLYAGFIRVSVPAADPTVAQAILQEMFQQYGRAGLLSQELAMAHLNDRDSAIPVDFRDPKTKLFDLKTYERRVRNISNRSTTEFREEQARELLAAKMRDAVRNPIRVSESEAWQEYDRRYSTATVVSIPVKESWAARWAVDVKPADAAAWVKDHQDDFDKTLRSRLAQDAPKAGKIRHILVKLPYGASDDEKAAALAKLAWALTRVRAGEPFAEVARDVSNDTGSAGQGGDVGDKTDGFVAPFAAAASALKPGEITAGAVETQFGYHLIMKDDPAKAGELEGQLRRSLPARMVTDSRATDAAHTVATAIADAIRKGQKPEDALRAVTSGYVRSEKIVALKVLPAPPDADAGARDDSKRATATGAADAGRSTDKAHATEPVKTAVAEIRFDASTDPDRPQPQTSSAFNRGGDPFPGLSPEGTAAVVAFAFSAKDGAVMADPVRMADAYGVVVLTERKAATRDEFEKNRDAFEQELMRSKRDEALALYVKRLREQAKTAIKVDDSYVQEATRDGGTGPADEDEDTF